VDDFITKPFDPAELAAKLLGAERLLSLETRELTIFALAKLAESRDPKSGTWSKSSRAKPSTMLDELFTK
jgi:putative two-component system response regulator